MSSSTGAPELQNTWADSLPGMFEPWAADEITEPTALVVNDELAKELGINTDWLNSPIGTQFLVGNHVLPGMTPIAQAYAGHQFGGYSPLLGDGRALLLGELVTTSERRYDIHLKGSGRTRFSRGGDGKAAVGPMLREYIIGEAMHALGIPTSRALGVVATNQKVRREEMLPGAVLCRVASSHIRVGSFQYAASQSVDHVQRLLDYSIMRHFSHLQGSKNSALEFLDEVINRQASLVSKWMHVGFIHGVMNTDNMAISGETIDYGPCAFMDTYNSATVFSSIDHQGRYAYGRQPYIAQWNLARLAESLLPLIDSDTDTAVTRATDLLQEFPLRFEAAWNAGMKAKLGLTPDTVTEPDFFHRLLACFESEKVDYTNTMRSLSSVARSGSTELVPALAPGPDFLSWSAEWLALIDKSGRDRHEIATQMDSCNPAYIPRNHIVEMALAAGSNGDLQPVSELVALLKDPFSKRDEMDYYTNPMPEDWEGYQTFCGT